MLTTMPAWQSGGVHFVIIRQVASFITTAGRLFSKDASSHSASKCIYIRYNLGKVDNSQNSLLRPIIFPSRKFHQESFRRRSQLL